MSITSHHKGDNCGLSTGSDWQKMHSLVRWKKTKEGRRDFHLP